jgi:hypothetical protein
VLHGVFMLKGDNIGDAARRMALATAPARSPLVAHAGIWLRLWALFSWARLRPGEGLPVTRKSGRWRPARYSSDGIDEEVWQRLADVLAVANRGDGDTFLRLLKRFDTWSDERRDQAASYLFYLLRYRVAEILGRRPAAEDLNDLAGRTHPKYAKVVRESVTTLEDTLRAVFMMAPTGTQQWGARLFVSGTAAAGVLFSDPSADLAPIRPHLAAWLSRDA